ncbi:MAG: cysteine--tRNA ligase [Planctomycetota bacterium]|nr:cysteine--tRNA ligase [Planctomycetota bacterium]
MLLYNTLSRRIEEFKPLDGKTVRMYSCGLTVYNHAHIGNFRSFIFADLLRRYLEYKNYPVLQVMNITDVGHMTTDSDEGEDKLELSAKKEKRDPYTIARFYENSFFEDLDALRLKRAHHYPRATEHIPEMIRTIQTLLDKNYAYIASDGVYFDITKFPRYGQLSGNTIDKLQAGARIEINPNKRHPADFALWKFDPHHIMQWDAPFGRGFPGWHIECSSMSIKYLGETFDIHTGGEDLIFPHHECEIAQAESSTGKPFVRFWLHVRFLLVDGKKMSKSLGNFYTVKDLLSRNYQPRFLRYALASTHYRQPLNFTLDSLDAAKNAIERIETFLLSLESAPCIPDDPDLEPKISELKHRFDSSMDNDLNISETLAVLFDFIRLANTSLNKSRLSQKQAQKIAALFHSFDSILAVLDVERRKEIPEEILDSVRQREQARRAKDYSTADSIREKLLKQGFIIEDTPSGPRCRRI